MKDVLTAIGVILAGVLFLGWLGLMVVLTIQGAARCLEAGWRDVSVSWNLRVYCVTRTDQTDIVKPLEWAVENPR